MCRLLFYTTHFIPAVGCGTLTLGKKGVASSKEVGWAEGTWGLWGALYL